MRLFRDYYFSSLYSELWAIMVNNTKPKFPIGGMSIFVHCFWDKIFLPQDLCLWMCHRHQDLSGMRKSLSGQGACDESRKQAKLCLCPLPQSNYCLHFPSIKLLVASLVTDETDIFQWGCYSKFCEQWVKLMNCTVKGERKDRCAVSEVKESVIARSMWLTLKYTRYNMDHPSRGCGLIYTSNLCIHITGSHSPILSSFNQ